MTLLQLKYIVTIAECSTISEAAKRLFITQPSLTASVKELEQELGITIFSRTNKGVDHQGRRRISWLCPASDRADGTDRRALFWHSADPASVLCLHPALLICGGGFCRTVEGTWRERV